MDRSFSHETEQGQLLATFEVGAGNYGLDTNRVQEVVLVGKVTPVHHAPDDVRGIINLRGKIVTVLDLSIKFQADRMTSNENRILIVRWLDEYVGLLVDRIGDVLALDEHQIRPVPANMCELHRKLVTGIYQEGELVYSILDLDAVLGSF